MQRRMFMALAALGGAFVAANAGAQVCPEKNIQYWQAFPAGGESDISARHQQAVLKKKCPGIETIVQYKPGAGGGLMWMQINQLPGDGLLQDEQRRKAAGENTVFTEEHVEALKAVVPSAHIVRIPNADHFVFRSNASEVLREVDEFIGGLPSNRQ